MGAAVVSPMLPETATMPESSTRTFLYLVVSAALLLYIYYRAVNKRFYELASKFQGPPTLPLLSHTIFSSSHKIFNLAYARSFLFNNVVRVWLGPRLAIFLADPRDIELVLGSSTHITKNVEYSFFQPWLGEGLLISNGKTWQKHRKIIAPTFHLSVLKNFFDLFNDNSRELVERLRLEVGKKFDIHDYMGEITVDILLETVMGVSKKTQENGSQYAMAVMRMCNILQMRQIRVWLRPDFLFKLTEMGKEQVKLLNSIHTLTKSVLYNKRNNKMAPEVRSSRKNPALKSGVNVEESKSKDKNGSDMDFSYGQSTGMKDDLDVDDIGEKKRLPFLDAMIENAQKDSSIINDKEVEDQVSTIMFEGHDTVAAASSFFLCVMADRKDIQERVMQELDEIFEDSDRPCTFQDTLEMKFLERCIMETLRMFPPVPIIARQVLEDLPLASDRELVIPANTTVAIGTFKLHRRPELYPNPDHFDPDNFLPERSASRHYYSFVPFSAGPRSCVGRKYAMLKLKVLLSTILRNFKVVGGKSMKDWKLQGDIILKRSDGFIIEIEPRQKTIQTPL